MYQYWQTAVDVYLLDLSQPDTPGSHSKHKGWSRRGVGWQETLKRHTNITSTNNLFNGINAVFTYVK